MRLLLAGFGNVGRTLAAILLRRGDHPGLAGLDVSVVAITTGSHGALARPGGIDLAAALDGYGRLGGFVPGDPDHASLTTLEAAAELDYDVLVEMTPLTVAARGEPAISHVRAALSRGRHVVSCNKGPVAWAYRSLDALARRAGRAFLHEAAVMDGVPVFNLARCCLPGATVHGFEGILNSTTNVVLAALERGASMDDAVAEARRLGVAEADPSADLEGWDAAVKVAALANVLMDGELAPEAVAREAVGADTASRARAAAAAGRRVKVVCEASRDGGRVTGRVALRELGPGDPFALVEGTGSALRLFTDLPGRMVVTEEHPDLFTTAYGAIADLLAIRDGFFLAAPR